MTRDELLKSIGRADLIWSNRFAEEVPVDPFGRSVEPSDYNVHHHEVSASGSQEVKYVRMVRRILRQRAG